MSTTTSKGYKKPDTGDFGSSFFKDLEDNIDRMNSHNHDGVNGEKVKASNLVVQTTELANGDWEATSGGHYRQSADLPTGVLFSTNTVRPRFYINSGAEAGSEVQLSYEKFDDSTIYVYINDNSLDILIVYA